MNKVYLIDWEQSKALKKGKTLVNSLFDFGSSVEVGYGLFYIIERLLIVIDSH